ncbi:MAG: glycoside hydrolase family 16 protein [Alphaproteobacteria bacterium]|nr:glycoside hydrolase family 16 protein [Alphaproteobacteria bacterium]
MALFRSGALIITLVLVAALIWSLAAPLSFATEPGKDGPLGSDGGWTPVFVEEFNGTSLDLTKWTTCYWWNNNGCTNSSNNNLQWYLPGNVTVSDGLLRLRARPEPVVGHEGRIFPYTSGMVTTGRDYSELPRPSRVRFLYGHFEIRAKVPSGQGLWPALWLLPDDRESRPEIDILEVLGDTPDKLRMHLHVIDPAGEERSDGDTVTVQDLSKNWHVYGLRWEPGAIIWYLDGVEKWRFDDALVVPSEPMYLLMNLAVGGDWPGPPDSSTRFPADFLIDSVRVWRRTE